MFKLEFAAQVYEWQPEWNQWVRCSQQVHKTVLRPGEPRGSTSMILGSTFCNDGMEFFSRKEWTPNTVRGWWSNNEINHASPISLSHLGWMLNLGKPNCADPLTLLHFASESAVWLQTSHAVGVFGNWALGNTTHWVKYYSNMSRICSQWLVIQNQNMVQLCRSAFCAAEIHNLNLI